MSANDTQTGGDHYKRMGIEPWDVCDTWTPLERIGAYRHGVLKYTMRMGQKPNEPVLKDARKALHYAQKLVETIEQLEAEARIQQEAARKRAQEEAEALDAMGAQND